MRNMIVLLFVDCYADVRSCERQHNNNKQKNNIDFFIDKNYIKLYNRKRA